MVKRCSSGDSHRAGGIVQRLNQGFGKLSIRLPDVDEPGVERAQRGLSNEKTRGSCVQVPNCLSTEITSDTTMKTEPPCIILEFDGAGLLGAL